MIPTKYYMCMAILVALYLLMYSYKENMEGQMESIRVDIGNFLVVYYCQIVKAFKHKRDFQMSQSQLKDKFIKNNFVQYLPKDIPFNPSIYKQFKEHGLLDSSGCLARYWRLDDANKIKIATIMKPIMQPLLDEALQRSGLDNNILMNHPVIHFRCADTPFIKNQDYRFQKYTYFKDALDKIQQQTGNEYTQITILSYLGHKSDEQKQRACSTYVESLKQYLESLNYKVDIASHSNIEDFAILFYAPAVISTGSSYSFMSGMFGNSIYVQPTYQSNDGMETTVDAEYMDDATYVLDGYNIDHTDLDYFDTDNILHMLKN